MKKTFIVIFLLFVVVLNLFATETMSDDLVVSMLTDEELELIKQDKERYDRCLSSSAGVLRSTIAEIDAIVSEFDKLQFDLDAEAKRLKDEYLVIERQTIDEIYLTWFPAAMTDDITGIPLEAPLQARVNEAYDRVTAIREEYGSLYSKAFEVSSNKANELYRQAESLVDDMPSKLVFTSEDLNPVFIFKDYDHTNEAFLYSVSCNILGKGYEMEVRIPYEAITEEHAAKPGSEEFARYRENYGVWIRKLRNESNFQLSISGKFEKNEDSYVITDIKCDVYSMSGKFLVRGDCTIDFVLDGFSRIFDIRKGFVYDDLMSDLALDIANKIQAEIAKKKVIEKMTTGLGCSLDIVPGFVIADLAGKDNVEYLGFTRLGVSLLYPLSQNSMIPLHHEFSLGLGSNFKEGRYISTYLKYGLGLNFLDGMGFTVNLGVASYFGDTLNCVDVELGCQWRYKINNYLELGYEALLGWEIPVGVGNSRMLLTNSLFASVVLKEGGVR